MKRNPAVGLLGFPEAAGHLTRGRKVMSLVTAETLRRIVLGGGEADPPPIAVPLIREIQATVADYFGVTLIDLLSERQNRGLAHPRQVAMWLARTLTFSSIKKIGKAFRRDHSTVLHAVKQIKARRGSDKELDKDLDTLISILTPRNT